MRRGAGRLAGAALVTVALLLGSAGPGLAAPARPTVDPTAPTPTAPHPGRPPQGSAPGGGTVGGEDLDTRGLVVADGTPPLPDGVPAHGWLVADALSGEVLAARDPHGRYYPASTLKTLTLLTLVPRLDPAQVVDGTVEDEQVEGSRVGLVAGGRYPVSLLFQAMVLQSGNDAANALARAAGGVDATLAAMNATAAEIGAFDTVAGTPSGLDVAGQSSSPYDLALVFRRLVADPATAAYLTTPTAQMPPVEGRSPGYQIQNQNPLATYPGGLGGKTGFTDAARHTFVTAAERDGRRLVVSVMDAENLPVRAADQARLLLDWGFTTDAATAGVGRLVDSGAEALAAPEAAADPTTAAPSAGPPLAGTSPTAAPDDEDDTPVVAGIALAALAGGVVVATVVGRRRAVIRPPARTDAGSPSTQP